MKEVLISIIVGLLFVNCETDIPEFSEQEGMKFVAKQVKQGRIVEVDNDGISIGGIIVGVIEVKQSRKNLITCDPFGWGPEYDWFCKMTGSKGRSIARYSESPESSDFGVHNESPSEDYPTDMTSTLYYSSDYFVHASDTDVSYQALRSAVASWGAGWDDARIDYCSIDSPTRCNQD